MMGVVNLNFILVKNCRCMYCNGKDTIHAVSQFFPNGVHLLAIEDLALSVGGITKRELLGFRRQLEKMSFEGKDRELELNEERVRLIKTVVELIKNKNLMEAA